MQRKIIIGYQDTPQGSDALALGALLGGALHARPIVATVLPWSRQLMNGSDLDVALNAATAEAFAVACERLAELSPETRAIANHSSGAALYELATAEHASLIVVGSIHRGPIGRMFLGSVGRALLHGAPCAVAVAPGGYADAPSPGLARLGVAFDGSAESWVAFETAVALAERLDAALTVVSVADAEQYGYAVSLSILTAAEFHEFEREETQRTLQLALDRAPADLDVDGRLLTGPAGPALVEVSDEVDLMIAGSRGYGALKRTALGSVSSHLTTAAACPLLVVPRGVGMDPLRLGGLSQRKVRLGAR